MGSSENRGLNVQEMLLLPFFRDVDMKFKWIFAFY